MHAGIGSLDIEHVIKSGPIPVSSFLSRFCWFLITLGILTFGYGLFSVDPKHFWGAYYTSFWYFTGISIGAVIASVIFQIVRATWAVPIRRIAEANVAFLPWAYLLFLLTYGGREYLFPWGTQTMPGKEAWMEPNFVYLRFALGLALLFYLIWRFVTMSLRGDVGMVMERIHAHKADPHWTACNGPFYRYLTTKWEGVKAEVARLQPQMSRIGPIVIAAYAVIYSLFAFEMLMGMDAFWYSNMFGGFVFVGNIFMGWAAIALMAILLSKYHAGYRAILTTQQLWDLGKLTFGFTMLWGYLFFSQFLPQWYGNLPEETQWLILRTRDWTQPWIWLGWLVFSMCFVIPFILLLSRDLKKTPVAYGTVCLIIFAGMWLEKYVIVMPNLSPSLIPFSWVEVGFFLGFLGVYLLSVRSLLAKVPFAPISHPTCQGRVDW